MAKVSRSVTIDEELLKVSVELLPNRSIGAEQGILDAVNEKIKQLKPESAKAYRKRLAHLTSK